MQSYIREKKFIKCPQCGIPVEKTKYCNIIYCSSQICEREKKMLFDQKKKKKKNWNFIQTNVKNDKLEPILEEEKSLEDFDCQKKN